MLLFIDTETGGLDPLSHSLLTVAGKSVIDDDGYSGGEIEVLVIPKNRVYRVTQAALAINKLDLREQQFGVDDGPRTSRQQFLEWLDWGRKFDTTKRYTVIGWNTAFDLGFIHEQFIDKDTWHSYVDRRYIDLCGVAQFLGRLGKIKPKNYHLNTVANELGISTPAEHTACGDVETTYAIWQALSDQIGKAHAN